MQGFQKLPPKRKEEIERFMQMFSLSAQNAYACMKNANFKIEMAINKFLNPIEPYIYESNFPGVIMNNELATGNIISIDDDDDIHQIHHHSRSHRRNQYDAGGARIKREQYKKTYMIKKKDKQKKYPSHRKKSKGKSTPESSQSKQKTMDIQFNFVQKMQALLETKTDISFKDDLCEVFGEMLESKKLVALHCIKFSQQNQKIPEQSIRTLQDYIKQLYRIPEFVCNMNKTFLNYGLDPAKFDFEYYSFMKDFINKNQDQFYIIVLRLNQKTHKVQVFRKLKIAQIFKLGEPQNFKITIQEVQRANNRFAYNSSVGIKPMSLQQKRKLEEDRIIRQQQENQYYQNIKFKQELQIKQQPNGQQEEKKQQAHQVSTKVLLSEKKAKIRQSFKQFTSQQLINSITFKIRLPNGFNIQLALPKQQKVSYLFDYIYCYQDKQTGFQNNQDRNFELLQPFDKIFLTLRKQQELGKVFQNSDMETLIVKEQ